MTVVTPAPAIDEMTLDELRIALGRVLPAHAVFDGWSEEALNMAAQEVGVPFDRAQLAFAGGQTQMIGEWIASVDIDMRATAASPEFKSLKIRDKIRSLIWTRFEQAAPHREAVRRAVAILALPKNAAISTRTLWRTADSIWQAAGDTSADFNHYTKRMMVSAVYSSTLLVWLNDESEGSTESSAFLDRRINNVMQIEKAKARWNKSAINRPSLVRFLGRLRYPAK